MNSDHNLNDAAKTAGISDKAMRKNAPVSRVPGDSKQPKPRRTRRDPFKDVWMEVVEKLEVNPGLQATALFNYLKHSYPGKFRDGQVRTLQRRIKQWRVRQDSSKEALCRKEYVPGEQSQSRFTSMDYLKVTIQGEPFKHMLFHYVLPFSGWEYATVCVTESFESLSEGLQRAVTLSGGVPERHQTDAVSALVQHSEKGGAGATTFSERYQALMRHYGLKAHDLQPGSPLENDVLEQQSIRLQQAILDALSMRTSSDFENREAYERFIDRIIDQLNGTRRECCKKEVPQLKELPSRWLEPFTRHMTKVADTSMITVVHNTYSVHSRLIGEQVEVRVYSNHLEVWIQDWKLESMPRLRGRGQRHIQYPHVIDSLVRKPWAFARYVYREEFFPSHVFRTAYDRLKAEIGEEIATDKAYLRILLLAAQRGETLVEAALQTLLNRATPLTAEAAEALLETPQETPKH